jgi:hypothetical protein
MSQKIAEAYVEISARMDKMEADLKTAQGKFTTATNNMQKSAGGLTASMDKMKLAYAGAAAFIGGAFVGAITSAIKSTADHLDQLDEMSSKTGVSVEMLTSLELAAKQNSVSMEKLATSIRMMYRSMYEANEGTKESVDAYKRLGVEIKDAQGNLKSGNEAFLEVADAISKIQNPAEKSALAMKVFGRAGAEMIPMLNGGRKALEGYINEAKRLGLVITSEDAARGAAFNDMLDAFTKTLTRLKEVIALWPMEQMTKVFAMLTGSELPDGAKASVRQKQIKDVVEQISDAQKKILQLEASLGDNAAGRSLFTLNTPALRKELAETEQLLGSLYNQYLEFEDKLAELKTKNAPAGTGGGGGGGAARPSARSATAWNPSVMYDSLAMRGLKNPSELIGPVREVQETLIDTFTHVGALMEDIQSQWASTIAEFIRGGQTFNEFMANMFEDVLEGFSRMLGDMASKWMMQSLFNGIAGSWLGGGTSPSMPASTPRMGGGTSIVINAVDAQSFDDALRRNAASVTNIVYESQHYGRAS